MLLMPRSFDLVLSMSSSPCVCSVRWGCVLWVPCHPNGPVDACVHFGRLSLLLYKWMPVETPAASLTCKPRLLCYSCVERVWPPRERWVMILWCKVGGVCAPIPPPMCLQVFKHITPLSYIIRRIVCPAILLNCTESRIMLPSIFKAVLGTGSPFFSCLGCVLTRRWGYILGCVTSMWTHYRQSLKAELGILAHVVLLRCGPGVANSVPWHTIICF